MRSTLSVLVTLVASAVAYQVISPNESRGWTNSGPQVVTWQRVDTDPLNFTAVLTNQRVSGYEPQVLAALVDGTLLNTTLNPPGGAGGGWPTGTGFRLNLVRDTNNNSILAQSPEFSILEPSGSSTIRGPTTSFSNASPTNTAPGNGGVNTDPIQIPTNGASSYQYSTALIAALTLLGVTMA